MHQVLSSVLMKHQITQKTQPPCSTDLSSCKFWLFPKLKSPLKGKRFQTIYEIQENTTGQLMAIPTKDFAECFEQWKRCWENCVRSQDANFGGDWSIMSYEQCFLCLVSSSMWKMSIFHIIWLGTCWTDCGLTCKLIYFDSSYPVLKKTSDFLFFSHLG